MAKQRPSLGVSASPISTYVAPVAAASAGLELYDQQTVNLALQFSEAFQNLSLTAANFAGSLKAESNKEELQKGLDLVNSSQKTYQQLVEDGQIRPTENPWLAIGAQQGSGMMEGMKARAHFMETYQKRAAEDPKFYDSLDSFNALASQYAQNVGTSLKDSPYQSRAFFEAFNPFVSSMSLKHQENVAKTAENKVLMGVGASVAQLTQDIKSQDPIVRREAMQAFRNSIDELGQMGVSRTRVNEAVVENMIALMETTDQADQVQAIYDSLDFGYGLVKNTAHAKALYAQRAPNIERNRQKLTQAKDSNWRKFVVESAPSVAFKSKLEQIEFLESSLPEVVGSVSPEQFRSMIAFGQSEIEEARREQEAARKETIADTLAENLGKATQGPIIGDPQAWAKDRINETTDLVNALGLTGVDRQRHLTSATSTINSLAEQELAKREAKAEDEVYKTLTALGKGYDETIPDGLEPDAYKEAALKKLEEAMTAANTPEKQRINLRASLEKDIDGNAEERLVASTTAKMRGLQMVNDSTLMQGVQSFMGFQADGSIDMSRAGPPPNVQQSRALVEDFMVKQGVVIGSEQGQKIFALEAQRSLDQIKTLRQNLAQNFTGKTLSPTDQDRPGEREQKAVIRQRLLASEMMLSQTYENRLLAGQIGQSMQTLLTPGTTEAEASVGAFEDLLFAFAFAKQAGVEPRYILPSGDVGKAMEEEIQFSLGQLEMGQSPQDIAKDISARRYFGSQSRMTPEQMMDPLAYLSVRGGAPETREITSQFMLVRDRMGINNPDAQPFMTAEFRKNYLEALNVSRDHKTALRSATDKMSKDYVVIGNSVLPLEALPPNVAPQAAPGYIQNLMETRYPGQKATLVVVARDDIDGTPLMAVRTPNGESVPGAVGLLKPKDLALTSTDLMNEGATTRRVREREMRRERELTSMRPKF